MPIKFPLCLMHSHNYTDPEIFFQIHFPEKNVGTCIYTSATDFVTCGFQGVQLNIEIMDDDPKPGFDDFVELMPC